MLDYFLVCFVILDCELIFSEILCGEILYRLDQGCVPPEGDVTHRAQRGNWWLPCLDLSLHPMESHVPTEECQRPKSLVHICGLLPRTNGTSTLGDKLPGSWALSYFAHH